MILIRKYVSAIFAVILVSLAFYVIIGSGSGVAEASSPPIAGSGIVGMIRYI